MLLNFHPNAGSADRPDPGADKRLHFPSGIIGTAATLIGIVVSEGGVGYRPEHPQRTPAPGVKVRITLGCYVGVAVGHFRVA